jgi:hypothetical protein
VTALVLALALGAPTLAEQLDRAAAEVKRAACYDAAHDQLAAAELDQARAARGSREHRAAGARWIKARWALDVCRTRKETP